MVLLGAVAWLASELCKLQQQIGLNSIQVGILSGIWSVYRDGGQTLVPTQEQLGTQPAPNPNVRVYDPFNQL